MKKNTTPITPLSVLREEWALFFGLITMVLFLFFGDVWLADLSSLPWFALVFIWLFAAMLSLAFAIVRHAESLAVLLGEPYGTLILTLALIGVEVLMISIVMLTSGKDQPEIARDTNYSIVMSLLGGMAGASLLLGGLKHHEQDYNLQGANAYLAMIFPLAVICLVLPNFTTSTQGPTLSPFQAVFTSIMSLSVYGVFLAVQTSRYRSFFVAPEPSSAIHTSGFASRADDAGDADTFEEVDDSDLHGEHELRSTRYHAVLLLAYIFPLVLLAKQFAIPLEHATNSLNAPKALSGFLIALLILAPEALSAVRAALRNQLQRSINILLGSVLATIALTVPAVLIISLLTGKTVYLGLSGVNSVLLVLLLGLSTITFSNARTNALLGAVHLLLFFAFLMLMFEG
ncbi:MAG TPA: hypothetical protein PLK77_09135 [Pyrinomonadaceae bacterium]|nr:hypothetical protein [Pyrinomonadaceae bacterium]